MTKKIIGLFLLFLMLLSGVVYPMKAYAIIGILDVSIDIPYFVEWILRTVFDIITQVLKQRLMTWLTNDVVGWIQGDQEMPRFIDDFKGMLKESLDVAAGGLIRELAAKETGINLNGLCYPIEAQLVVQVRKQQPRPIRTQLECTLSDMVGNVSTFYNEFKDGGWLAYQETLMPQNNIFGIKFLTNQSLLLKEDEEKEVAKHEAEVGGGFLGTKACSQWEMVLPGSVGLGLNKNVIKAGTDAWEDSYFNNSPDGKLFIGNTGATPEIGEWVCTQEQETTPGDIVGGMVAQGVGAGVDSFITADEITEVVGALINALITRIKKESFGLLQRELSERSATPDNDDLSELSGDPEGESIQAALYEAKRINKKEQSGQSKVSSKVGDHGDSAEFADSTSGGSGGTSSNLPQGSEESSPVNLPSDYEVPKNMADLYDNVEDDLNYSYSIMKNDLDNFGNDALDIMKSDLELLSQENTDSINKINELINCWSDKIKEAENLENIDENTINELNSKKEEAASMLAEAQSDTDLIDSYLNNIGDYKTEVANLLSDLEIAYRHDILDSNLEAIAKGEADSELDNISYNIYPIIEEIEDIKEKINEIQNRLTNISTLIDQCEAYDLESDEGLEGGQPLGS